MEELQAAQLPACCAASRRAKPGTVHRLIEATDRFATTGSERR
jgi:hypothetical protein